MSLLHIITEAFIVGVIIFGAWAFVDTMRQAKRWKDKQDDE